MTYFRTWFLWLFLIITKQICNCLYSCSWGTSLTLCLKHLQHKEQFEALADTVTSEWWLRTPQQPDSKDSEVVCLSLSSFAQKLVWVWPFQKEKYPCPAPTCPATVPDTTLLWPSPPSISWLSKMVSQRFFPWEPQETVQNSSMGADGMSWRKKRKIVTETSFHGETRKHESCRAVTTCKAARNGPMN